MFVCLLLCIVCTGRVRTCRKGISPPAESSFYLLGLTFWIDYCFHISDQSRQTALVPTFKVLSLGFVWKSTLLLQPTLGLNSVSFFFFFFSADSIFPIPTFIYEEARIQRLEERRQTFIKFLLCARLTAVFLCNAVQSSQGHLRDIKLKCIFSQMWTWRLRKGEATLICWQSQDLKPGAQT